VGSLRAKIVAYVAATAAALLLAAIIAVNMYVARSTASAQFASTADVPLKPVAVVFGAGIEADGEPSGMLADRLDAAIDLYRSGRVKKLLFSGDNGSVNYNEVGAMLRYAMRRGIPVRAMTPDYAGFNTYATCYRAKTIFGVRSATLVTQRYHLPRALYICQQLGIDVVGVGTPDWGREPDGMMLRLVVREYLATLLASWELNVTHPRPKYLGRYEGLR